MQTKLFIVVATNNALSVHARVTFLTLDKTAGIMFLHESNQSRKLEAAVMGACVWMLVTDRKKHTSNKHFNRRNENGGCVIGGGCHHFIYTCL